MSQKEIFSIRQMVELTGLSEFTLRGWENRYSVFTPQRTGTGRRKYSKLDVERALLLRELLKRGHRIGQVADLSAAALKRLFTQDSNRPPGEVESDAIDSACKLLALQKWSDLESLIRSVPTGNSVRLVNNFLLPLLTRLGSDVAAGLVSIAQEHVLSALLKEKIYAALSRLKPSTRRHARFVLAAPEGDFHEMGLLLAHLMIRQSGFQSLFLGPHTPAQDLTETALRFHATHLLIVATVSKRQGAVQDLLSYVADIQKKSGSHLKILVSGGQAPTLATPPLECLRTFGDLTSYLQTCGSHA